MDAEKLVGLNEWRSNLLDQTMNALEEANKNRVALESRLLLAIGGSTNFDASKSGDALSGRSEPHLGHIAWTIRTDVYACLADQRRKKLPLMCKALRDPQREPHACDFDVPCQRAQWGRFHLFLICSDPNK